MKSAYPVQAELQAFLEKTGFATATVTGLDLASALPIGRQQLERETDRIFLAVSGTREFDPPTNPGGVLDLRADLVSVSSLTYDGTAWAAGTDYRLQPYNAADDGLPYTRIQFKRRWAAPLPWSLQKLIVITGSWGFGAEIPEDAWTAMLAGSALALLPQLAHLQAKGMISWKEAEDSENYGPDPLGYLQKHWGRIVGTASQRYRRVTVGL